MYQQLKLSLIEQWKTAGVLEQSGVEYDPIRAPAMETKVIGLIKDGQLVQSTRVGDEVEVVLAGTPFYVESGGQVSDVGVIANYSEQERGEPIWGIEVRDMRRPAAGPRRARGRGDQWASRRSAMTCWALVDYDRRAGHHAQSHGHALAARASCAGAGDSTCSRPARWWRPIGLRFDFTHGSMLTQEEIDRSRASTSTMRSSPTIPVDAAAQDYKDAVSERRDGAVRRKIRRRGARDRSRLAR